MVLKDKFGDVDFFLLASILPAVFIFLWTLIFGDFKNFEGSRKAYSIYTAKDPINCYQDFKTKKESS